MSGCLSCFPGQYANTTSATSCSPCPAGFVCLGGNASATLTPCGSGRYSAIGSSVCAPCAAGYTCTASSSSPFQSACAAGQFSSSGSATCSPCPAGSMCTSPPPVQTQCAAGQYSTDGATVCSNCSAGYVCGVGSTMPTQSACGPGQYSLSGSASCANCSAGYVCGAASTSPTQLACGLGQFSVPGSSECSNCTTDVECGLTASASPTPSANSSSPIGALAANPSSSVLSATGVIAVSVVFVVVGVPALSVVVFCWLFRRRKPTATHKSASVHEYKVGWELELPVPPSNDSDRDETALLPVPLPNDVRRTNVRSGVLSGAQGTVHVRNINGNVLAVKVLTNPAQADAELQALNRVCLGGSGSGIENIVAYRGWCRVKDQPDKRGLVMDYAAGGSLRKWMESVELRLAPADVRMKCQLTVARQIASGMEFVHRAGYVHCDLKPENVLLMSPYTGPDSVIQVKVADFGMAVRVEDELGRPIVPLSARQKRAGYGTRGYIAPELAAADGDSKSGTNFTV